MDKIGRESALELLIEIENLMEKKIEFLRDVLPDKYLMLVDGYLNVHLVKGHALRLSRFMEISLEEAFDKQIRSARHVLFNKASV